MKQLQLKPTATHFQIITTKELLKQIENHSDGNMPQIGTEWTACLNLLCRLKIEDT